MSGAKVSVITPSYNQAQFIRETIESVSNQTYNNVEHIVVDGGSTDATVDILREYNHLNWVSEADNGQTHAIRKGLDMATGDIVTWLNSDDIYVGSNTIEAAVDSFGGDTSVVFGDLTHINERTQINHYSVPPKFDYCKLRSGLRSIPPQQSTFFDIDLFQKHSPSEAYEYIFDFEQWLRLGKDAETKYTSDIISGFRWHDESKSVSDSQKFTEERKRLISEYPGYSNNVGSLLKAEDVVQSGAVVRRLIGLQRLYRLEKGKIDLALEERISVAGLDSILANTVSRNPRA